MRILGLNAYHGDSAACLIENGRLIAAVEEERFTRIKHWAGFPRQSVDYCLREAGIPLTEVDALAVNRSVWANLGKKLLFALRTRPSIGLIGDRCRNMGKVKSIKDTLVAGFGLSAGDLKATVYHIEHHKAHLASSFYLSGFDEAALVSVDGFGDFTSCMVATGRDKNIRPLSQVHYPHSLGVFYSALTQFLGFPEYGDEYKVMGLAGFGRPAYVEKLQRLVRLKPDGFDLDLSFFQHHVNGDEMQWNGTSPTFGRYYSSRLAELLGKPRNADEPLTDFHADLAASVQAVYEQALFHVLRRAYDLTRSTRLCLAGGCALNSAANGKICDHTPFKEVYIPPGAHDAGGCIGAAYYVWHHVLGEPRSFVMKSACWGPHYDDEAFSRTLAEGRKAMNGCSVTRAQTEEELIRWTADLLAQGKIVGWFQGRMEWGPRALGNRSILADPRRADMREMINAKIKFREKFRPFAPSVLEEQVGEYFEKTHPAPFMLKVYPIRSDKRQVIPAVTHVDGTGRLQTVDATGNPLYWKLINAFGQKTGVPVLLNTSFNENEPIVCRPEEALACFLRTSMDVLVMGNWVIERR